MSISSDGVLVFGFTVGEEGEKPDFLGECDYMDDFIGDPWTKDGHDARKTLIDACPADLTLYCSYEYPMHILSVRGTEMSARRGEVFEVTRERLSVAPERIAAFKAWCEMNKVEYQEPKWLLCSMYG